MVFGAEREGTGEIAERLAATLRRSGHRVDVAAARHALDVAAYEAVMIGGEIEGGHWHRDARQFVLRHTMALRDRRVWFFSCAATDADPTPEVRELMDFVCARGHATFAAPRRARGVAALAADWAARRRIGRWVRALDDGARPAALGWQAGAGLLRLWVVLRRAARRAPPGLPGPTVGR